MSVSTEAARPIDRLVVPLRAARFRDVVLSEWTKVRSLRSIYWTVIVAIVLSVGLGALISALAAHEYANGTNGVRAGWDPTAVSEAGGVVAQLAIGVLGVMLITSEYSSRAIATYLTAVPRRSHYLGAKALVTLGLTFLVTAVSAFTAFFIGQALMSGHAPIATLTQPHVFRALVGSAMYGALIGLLGLALGTLLRSAAAAISMLVAVLFVLPGVAAALPTNIQQPVEKFWPSQAGGQITSVVRSAHTLGPWAGFGVLSAFVLLVLALALFRLSRRDA